MEPRPSSVVWTDMVLMLLFACASPPVPGPTSELEPEGSRCASTVQDLDAFDEDPRWTGDALVIVDKDQRALGLYQNGDLSEDACWPVGLAMRYPPGHKQRQGDRKTPEGWYRTHDKPWSSYYGALYINYPSPEDAKAAVADGRIDEETARRIDRAHGRGVVPPQDTVLGGEILIHGGGSTADWTLGCVALDDGHIDALREALPSSLQVDVMVLP